MMTQKKRRLSANDNRGPKKSPFKNVLLWGVLVLSFVLIIYFLAQPSDWIQFSQKPA